jgi:superfamily II DNA or RNA helicase
MIEIIKRSGILIPRKYEDREFYVRIKEELERRTKAYQTSNFVIHKFYLESEKFLLVPRNFPIQSYIFQSKETNYQNDGDDIDIEHNITPRSLTQERAIDRMLRSENCILQLMPGVGKTVISIYMIATRKKKSIILVHKDALAVQWKDRFEQFTNLKPDDIVRLTSATFKEDLKRPINIVTTQMFLSLLKRKREEFLTELDKSNIGVSIADEVHTSVGAPTFSECEIHLPCKYNYGLSATPYRYDGNGDIIEYHLGPIFSDDDIQGTMKPRVTVLLLDYLIDTARSYTYIHWGGKFQRTRYLNRMIKSKPFLAAMRGLLTRLKDSRDIICMVERIKLIDKLYGMTNTKSKSKFCGTGGLETLRYKMTFATPGKARDGIDAPWKDCVIMTSPISNIEQLTGRVVREQEGKKTPIIIDMVDCGSRDISRTFHNRLKFYKDKGWDVQFIYFGENSLQPINEDQTKRIISS